MISAIALSYMQKVGWAAKFALGIINLFIGIVLFAWYGTEPIQKFFALPLYLLYGILFLWESRKYKDDILKKPNTIQIVLLLLYLSYPTISIFRNLTGIKLIFFNAYEDIILLPCGLYGITLFVKETRQSKAA